MLHQILEINWKQHRNIFALIYLHMLSLMGLTKFFESENYDDRNETAVSWYALGGWIDDTVYITIGDCQFMLY